jgi:hypothetical protein
VVTDQTSKRDPKPVPMFTANAVAWALSKAWGVPVQPIEVRNLCRAGRFAPRLAQAKAASGTDIVHLYTLDEAADAAILLRAAAIANEAKSANGVTHTFAIPAPFAGHGSAKHEAKPSPKRATKPVRRVSAKPAPVATVQSVTDPQ